MNPSQDRKSLWRTGLIEIIALLLFVGAVQLIVSSTNPNLSGTPLLIVGLVLALIPAILWHSFFYAQDHLEPEPRHYVVAVAVLAALLGAAVGQPLLERGFEVSRWIGRDALTEILASILLIGFTQMFLIYAAVRFSVYYSNELDQRVDGVVYGTAAGVGYATLLNVRAVLEGGGLDLSAGIVRIVVTALVYSALGGLLGYFIARAKFDDEPFWWMPTGLAIAAAITGLFSWLRGEITQQPLTITASGVSGGYNPYPALIAGAVLAAALLAMTFNLMKRANQQTLAGADTDHA